MNNTSGFLASALLMSSLALSAAAKAADASPTALELLGELIAIPSTEETGRARESAELLAKHLLAAGFPEENVQLLGPENTIGGLVVRLPGGGEKRPVLLMAHLDVVPSVAQYWSSDPYKLVTRDDYLYGRGVSDNKTGAATLIANLIRLKKAGIVPERDLVVVLTLDEESNMFSIRWLLENHPVLLDAEFALNTDGGGVELVDGTAVTFGVQAAEKVYMTLEIQANNPGGHSSVPPSENAIYALAEALNRIGEYRFPVNLNDVTRAYFAASATSVDEPLASAMRDLANDKADEGQLKLLESTPFYNAQMRTTCVATQLFAGHAENALPTYARAVINCRILPQENAEDIDAELSRVIANDAIQMRRTYEPEVSPPSALIPEVLDRITTLATDRYPGIRILAGMSTGATDGLYTRSAGIPTYGISAIAQSAEGNNEHGIDERIAISAFKDSVEFWYRIMSTL